MSAQTKGALFTMMDDVLQKVASSQKEAKPVGDGSEPTTHPIENADAGTIAAQEGARSAENEADVRKDYGEVGNTGQEDANAANALNPSDSIGTQSQESDEVKGNVQDPKAEKDDPEQNGRGDGSPGHPSNLTFNEKYSSAQAIMKAGENILAGIMSLKSGADGSHLFTSENNPSKKTVDTKTEKEAKPEDSQDSEQKKTEDKADKEAHVKVASESEKRAAAEQYREDAKAGYMAGELLASKLGLSKTAEDEAVAVAIDGIRKKAESDAEVFTSFINGHVQGEKEAQSQLGKSAMGELPPGGGEEIPPELMAAMAGGGGGGGELPPELGMEGGMPPGAEGGMVPGAEGGMVPGMEGEGGGGEEEILEALAQAMAEEGVSPEQLVELAEGGGGGGMEGGGMEGGMEGGYEGEAAAMPPEAPPAGPPTGAGGNTGEETGAETGEDPEEKKEKEAAYRVHRKAAALKATLTGLLHSA